MQFAFFILNFFKNVFRKPLILSKIWKWRKWKGVGGSYSLRHYDAMRTKIDMSFTPYLFNDIFLFIWIKHNIIFFFQRQSSWGVLQIICSKRFYNNCPQGKVPLNRKTYPNPNPNLNPNRGTIFLGSNCPHTVKKNYTVNRLIVYFYFWFYKLSDFQSSCS